MRANLMPIGANFRLSIIFLRNLLYAITKKILNSKHNDEKIVMKFEISMMMEAILMVAVVGLLFLNGATCQHDLRAMIKNNTWTSLDDKR
jgi:hypothetical protein